MITASTAPTSQSYTIAGTKIDLNIAEFTHRKSCPLTYSMSVDNTTNGTPITFDASTRVVSIETSDNMFGDSTFAVTITGTHADGSASLTFNVGTIKDCSGV